MGLRANFIAGLSENHSHLAQLFLCIKIRTIDNLFHGAVVRINERKCNALSMVASFKSQSTHHAWMYEAALYKAASLGPLRFGW